MYLRRALLGALVVVMTIGVGAALAEPSVVVSSIELEASEQQAEFTATNLTAATVRLEPGATGQSACQPTLNPSQLAGAGAVAGPTKVTVTLTGCDLANGLSLPIAIDGTMTTFTVTEAPAPTVDAGALREWYRTAAIAAAVSLILAIVLYMAGTVKGEADENKTPDGRPMFRTLYGIEPGWKFKDSWASNVTIVASGLAVFVASSDVMQELVGASADAKMGTIVVGSAMAAALIAASPLAVMISREIGDGRNVTQLGLAVGAFLTLMGTMAEILLLTGEGDRLIDGWVGDIVAIAGFVGLVAVGVYGIWSLARLFGQTEKPEEKPSETAAAAATIALSIRESLSAPPRGEGMPMSELAPSSELSDAIDSLLSGSTETRIRASSL